MEKVKMEEVKRKRGRPKLDAHITEEYAPSRRQALNKMYMYEGVHLLSVAATYCDFHWPLFCFHAIPPILRRMSTVSPTHSKANWSGTGGGRRKKFRYPSEKLLLYSAKADIMGAGNRCYVPASREVKKQDAGKIQCWNLLQAQSGR